MSKRPVGRSVVALLVGALWACVLAAPAGAYAPRVPESFFGVSATDLWAITEQGRNAERARQLDGMKAAGLDWARIEIGWREIERQAPAGGQHEYTWTLADGLVEALASREMELMALPMAAPAWAADDPSCGRQSGVAAAHIDDYAAYVGAIMERYGRGGSFWAERPELPRVPVQRIEVWNEPNWNGFWCGDLEPELYGRMLEATADAVHGVDPEATVIAGGLADLKADFYSGGVMRGMAADEFLRRAIAVAPGLTSKLDAVALHTYDVDPALNFSLLGWFRSRLNDLGLAGAEIVLTEFGWPSGGLITGVLTEAQRATNYEVMANRIARTDCGVTAVAAHTWRSPELDLFSRADWLGITSPLTGLLKASGIAYRDQVALFEGRGPAPAPRETIRYCGAPTLPDQDGDGIPDQDDDHPLDPEQQSDPDEEPPPSSTEPERTHPQRIGDAYFGVSVVQLPTDVTRLGSEYEAMASARIGTARQQIRWSQVEPVPPGDPQYETRAWWSVVDRWVLKMASAGIALRPSFGGTPAWVPVGEFDARYAGFLARFAARYGVGGTFWAENRQLDEGRFAVREFEVWYHGNEDRFAPSGTATPAAYARTYLAARDALRGVDDQARAVVSLAELGRTGRAATFLAQMVDAEPALRGGIDGVMVQAEHSRDVFSLERVTQAMRYALNDSGNDAASLYLGFGAPTAGPGAQTEAARAQLFADMASRSPRSDCGVDGIFAHAWTTPEQDEGNEWDWFGIADPEDATLSPTAEAYRDQAAAFRGYGEEPAPSELVVACGLPGPDRDADGTPDAEDPEPLDPSVPESDPPPPPPAPPAPTISGGPASPTASRSATFSLAAERATGFECSLDGASFAACAAAPSFGNLGHGDHVLRVRALGSEGVVGPESVHAWSVDIVGPEILDLSGPASPSTDGVEFQFRAEPDATKLECRLDTAAWTTCSSPKAYASVAVGPHEFRVRASDELGNSGAARALSFAVAAPAPPGKPEILAGPGEGEVTGDARPVFTFRGQTSSLVCRFDDSAWQQCSSGEFQPAQDLSDGGHAFQVAEYTAQGGFSQPAVRQFAVDTAPPRLLVRLKRRSRFARNARAIHEASDESNVRVVELKLNDRRWQRAAPTERLRRLSLGGQRLTIRAVDEAGNKALAMKRWRVHQRR